MKKFLAYPGISSAVFPPGSPPAQPLRISAETIEEGAKKADQEHRRANRFATVSEWRLVEQT